jgi:hypothetical protein
MTFSPFDGPIPGQSLTREPGSAAWERPSKYSDPLDAFEMYMEQLADEDVLDNVMDMIDIGIPISVVSATMLGMGVMKGMHTVDVKLLLNPLLMTQLKTLAEAMNIEYKMTMDDYADKDAIAKRKRAGKLAAKLSMQTGATTKTPDAGDKIMQQAQQNLEEQDQQQEEMPMEAEQAPQGLMAKEQM